MNAAALELRLLQNRVTASAVNTLIERREPSRRACDQAVSQLLDEPVEPVISWLDSGCPRSKQSRSTHRAAALLFTLGILLTAGLSDFRKQRGSTDCGSQPHRGNPLARGKTNRARNQCPYEARA